MEVTRTVVADTVVLRVSGMHSHRDVGALLADVEHVLQGGDRHIVLNLEEVTDMGAAGLGELVKICVVVRACHARLALSAVPDHIRYLLATTNLSSFFEMVGSDREAVADAAHAQRQRHDDRAGESWMTTDLTQTRSRRFDHSGTHLVSVEFETSTG